MKLRLKNWRLIGERFERLYGSLLFFALLWLSVCAVSIYGPLLVFLLQDTGYVWLAVCSWLAWCLGGLLTMRNARRSRAVLSDAATWMIRLTPHVFFFGIIVLYSWAIYRVLFGFTWKGWSLFWLDTVTTFNWATIAQYLAAAIILTHVISSFTGVNRYSMHMFYRKRLAECFIGAWRVDYPAETSASGNDYPLSEACSETAPESPCVLLNASVNLSSRSRLAWQQRRSASFVFSPLFCGFEINVLNYETEKYERVSAFRPTATYRSGGGEITMALAMATSGAAVAPVLTSRGSPRLSFIASLLNLRLGFWLANPLHDVSGCSELPRSAVHLIMREFAGDMRHDGSFVYVSDGGHFENLGLYELVRRRCKLIIVSDASEDPKGEFACLGEAVERCRVDLGVEIELAIDDGEKPLREGTIYYAGKGDGSRTGRIIYIKPSVVGGAPADVVSFSRRREGFPHQSTVNQWFGESQFESYRRLGVEFGRLASGFLGSKVRTAPAARR